MWVSYVWGLGLPTHVTVSKCNLCFRIHYVFWQPGNQETDAHELIHGGKFPVALEDVYAGLYTETISEKCIVTGLVLDY